MTINDGMVVQAILWRQLDVVGSDACALIQHAESWRLSGTAVFDHAGMPCHLSYDVDCDRSWRAHRAQVRGFLGRKDIDWNIDQSPDGIWRLNGVDQVSASSCPDIDLAFTPATNLIPLRRLNLTIGQEAAAPAAWLDFPKTKLVELPQIYKRIDHDRYDYASPSVSYQGELRVTDAGFVTDYPALWRMQTLA